MNPAHTLTYIFFILKSNIILLCVSGSPNKPLLYRISNFKCTDRALTHATCLVHYNSVHRGIECRLTDGWTESFLRISSEYHIYFFGNNQENEWQNSIMGEGELQQNPTRWRAPRFSGLGRHIGWLPCQPRLQQLCEGGDEKSSPLQDKVWKRSNSISVKPWPKR